MALILCICRGPAASRGGVCVFLPLHGPRVALVCPSVPRHSSALLTPLPDHIQSSPLPAWIHPSSSKPLGLVPWPLPLRLSPLHCTGPSSCPLLSIWGAASGGQEVKGSVLYCATPLSLSFLFSREGSCGLNSSQLVVGVCGLMPRKHSVHSRCGQG